MGGDKLYGGPGKDVFRYQQHGESIDYSSAINNADIIMDFTKGEDKIDLSLLGYIGIGDKDLNICKNQDSFKEGKIICIDDGPDNYNNRKYYITELERIDVILILGREINAKNDFVIHFLENIDLDESDFIFAKPPEGYICFDSTCEAYS